jgi:outer membrane protein assembly factor BamD (BamD/ComL family)
VGKKTFVENLLLSLKNSIRCLGLALVMGVLTACGEDPQQLFETAQFEEQQHNQAHAQELYQRILRDHPASPVARKAKERLKELKTENQ